MWIVTSTCAHTKKMWFSCKSLSKKQPLLHKKPECFPTQLSILKICMFCVGFHVFIFIRNTILKILLIDTNVFIYILFVSNFKSSQVSRYYKIGLKCQKEVYKVFLLTFIRKTGSTPIFKIKVKKKYSL